MYEVDKVDVDLRKKEEIREEEIVELNEKLELAQEDLNIAFDEVKRIYETLMHLGDIKTNYAQASLVSLLLCENGIFANIEQCEAIRQNALIGIKAGLRK